jgi:phosphocarrier protein
MMESQNVVEKKFVIRNQLGLHARPAALLVETANRFQSEITVQKGKYKINAKSIMGVLMLAAGPGSRVTIRIIGPDAERAMEAIEKLISQNFGERN